jgi:hypothetical protein
MRIPPGANGVAVAIAFALACSTAQAQWSIGPVGGYQATPGKNRYLYLVFANPVPGMEVQFNDWYTTTHMGDLVQLQGWMGAQRFRLVNVQPRPGSAAGYRHGYLMIWDLLESSPEIATARMTAAIAGGKSRRGAAFDYTPGASAGGAYEVLTPRLKRPDGKGPFMPDDADNKTPRPNRYILMEFANPASAREADFDNAANERIKGMLTLPGWMAAQRFRATQTTARPGTKPRYLTLSEIEAPSAQIAHDTLTEATKSGKVKGVPMDESTVEIAYWEAITPYITKEDFVR